MIRFAIGRNLVLSALLGIVVYLTLIPLIMILYGTFRDGPPGTAASFTLANYSRAYGDLTIVKLGLNTMVFAVGAALVSFGFPRLAYRKDRHAAQGNDLRARAISFCHPRDFNDHCLGTAAQPEDRFDQSIFRRGVGIRRRSD